MFLLGMLILTFSFTWNSFHIANDDWFYNFQSDSEELVISRLMQSQEEGIFSGVGALCRYQYDEQEHVYKDTVEQYIYFTGGLSYKPYYSQIGLQGMGFSFINEFLPATNEFKLGFFYFLNSFAMASMVMLLTYWFYEECSFFSSLMVFLSFFLSPWVTVMARNLYWSLWILYLPMIISLWILYYEEKCCKDSNKIALFLISITVAIKAATGYEYMSTVLISMLVPLLYYSFSRKWATKLVVKRFLQWSGAGIVGFFLAMVIHIFQRGIVEGGWSKGLALILADAARRTYGDYANYDSVFTASLQASPMLVVIKYLFSIAAIWLIGLTVISINIIFFSKAREMKKYIKVQSLLFCTWFSLLAPLSWFVLAKGHSYIHTNINHILWTIPFSAFLFGLVGYLQIFIKEKWNFYCFAVMGMAFSTLLENIRVASQLLNIKNFLKAFLN